MTLEESIALADKFQKDLAQLESCERQIKDNNEAMSKPAKITVRRRSMFRYFWPWIIFAATVCCMILTLSIIFLEPLREVFTACYGLSLCDWYRDTFHRCCRFQEKSQRGQRSI